MPKTNTKYQNPQEKNNKLHIQGNPSELQMTFSVQTMKARRMCTKVLAVLDDYRCQPRLLYPAKMSVIFEGERKSFMT